MSQHAFLYFILRARAFRAYVGFQLFLWCGSIIPPTEEGPSRKRLVKKQIFDTFKSLLSLVFTYLCATLGIFLKKKNVLILQTFGPIMGLHCSYWSYLAVLLAYGSTSPQISTWGHKKVAVVKRC